MQRAGTEVVFTVSGTEPAVELRAPLPDGAQSVVVSVRRDPRQASSGLWVDGVERMAVVVPPGELVIRPADIVTGSGVKAARVFKRELSRAEVLEWQVVNAGGSGDGVVWMGGSEACALYEDGRLEAAGLPDGARVVPSANVR